MDKDEVCFSVGGDNYYMPVQEAIELLGEPMVAALLDGPPKPEKEHG